MSTVTVEKLDVGYLVSGRSSSGIASRRACMDLQDAFRALLFELEGRSYHFGGDSYGDVTVSLEKPAESASTADQKP